MILLIKKWWNWFKSLKAEDKTQENKENTELNIVSYNIRYIKKKNKN